MTAKNRAAVARCWVALYAMCIAPVGIIAQAKPAPPGSQAASKPPVVNTSFPCPDVEFQRGCKSYAELVAAKDAALNDHASGDITSLVCFRPKEDSFFLLSIDAPANRARTAPDATRGITKALEKEGGAGWVTEFVNGISTTSTMPVGFFLGYWSFPPFGPVFTADNLEGRDLAPAESIIVNPRQVSVDIVYQNREDRNVSYRLRVQRSTGRFTEQYTMDGAKSPFSENLGRCMLAAVKK